MLREMPWQRALVRPGQWEMGPLSCGSDGQGTLRLSRTEAWHCLGCCQAWCVLGEAGETTECWKASLGKQDCVSVVSCSLSWCKLPSVLQSAGAGMTGSDLWLLRAAAQCLPSVPGHRLQSDLVLLGRHFPNLRLSQKEKILQLSLCCL